MRRRWPLCGMLVGLLGCGPRPDATAVRLEEPDPDDRIRAIVVATRQAEEDPGADVTAALVDRLDDEDDAVRFFAIGALDRLTGRRFGYRAYDPVEVRRLAVERWRRYLEERGGAVDEERQGPF